jgi:hypothetical protein
MTDIIHLFSFVKDSREKYGSITGTMGEECNYIDVNDALQSEKIF